MDNATAEYAFINAFFASEPRHSKDAGGPMSPPILSPIKGEFDEPRSAATSDIGGSETMSPRRRVMSITSVLGGAPSTPGAEGGPLSKEEQVALNQIWKQVMDPVLEYVQTFVTGALEPPPPAAPLLTLIRLTEDVAAEIQRRGCGPLETFVFALRLKMWPIFQKLMAEHAEALKKLADGANAGGAAAYFRRAGSTTTDASVGVVCRRYVVLFNTFVALTEQPEETMIFSKCVPYIFMDVSYILTLPSVSYVYARNYPG